MKQGFSGPQDTTSFGEIGLEFQPNLRFQITALGRPVPHSQDRLLSECTVTLWDTESENVLAKVVVAPDSTHKNGFAYTALLVPISVLPNQVGSEFFIRGNLLNCPRFSGSP